MGSFGPAVPHAERRDFPLFLVSPAFKIVSLREIQRVLILMSSKGKLSHSGLVTVISSLLQGVPINYLSFILSVFALCVSC
jgi:hypothetical protein